MRINYENQLAKFLTLPDLWEGGIYSDLWPWDNNIIEWCNNIHQGAPRTGKQTSTCASDLGDGSHVTCL